ncbi:hypothetical protein [Lacrimispora sphenoides]|jgi:hypothetical protein|nr:hypothetical protein [Lacrimispora sphenoides]
MKELKSSLENIELVASKLITGIEDKFKEIQREYSVDKDQYY